MSGRLSSRPGRSRARSDRLYPPERHRSIPRSVPEPGAPSPGSEASSWGQIGAREAQSRSTHRGCPRSSQSSLQLPGNPLHRANSHETLSSAGDSDPDDSIHATDGVESPDWTVVDPTSLLSSAADMIAELNEMSQASARVEDTSTVDAAEDEEVVRLPDLSSERSHRQAELQRQLNVLSRIHGRSRTPEKAKNASSPALSVNDFTTRGVTYHPVLGFCHPDVSTLPLPRTKEEWDRLNRDSHGAAWFSASPGRSLASATGSMRGPEEDEPASGAGVPPSPSSEISLSSLPRRILLRFPPFG